MRKLIYGTLFLALVGLVIVGCEKETILSKNNKTSSLIEKDGIRFYNENGMLVFNSLENYELSVSDLTADEEANFVYAINGLNYTSYTEEFVNQGTNAVDLIEDNVLSAILNKDRVVQIANYIYKVNLQTEKVFVLPKAKISELNDLINENITNKNIRQFSTGDDVIYLAESGDPGEKCGGIDGCESVSDVVDFGNNIRCQAMVKHFRAGIYYRTTARFVPLTPGVINTELEIKGPEAWRKRRPCSSGTIGTSAAGVKVSGSTQKLWQFYSGTRNLNGLYLFTRIKCTFNGSVKYSTWCGRNVNSPY
jgi:hypothetical protein